MPDLTDPDLDLDAAERNLGEESGAHRPFFLPIVRAITDLGGRGRKRDVEKRVRQLLKDQLNDKQLDYLEINSRYGWARNSLKTCGIVGGERGYWELTDLGRAYAARHAATPIEIDLDVPEATEPARSNVVTESVPVTGFRAYEIPLLEGMATGLTVKNEIIAHVETSIRDRLLPGDLRLMPDGRLPVWEYRSHWAISNLGKDGLAENIGTGRWSITSAGRDRLEKERATWDVSTFSGSQAKVRVEGDAPAADPVVWNTDRWNALRRELPKAAFEQIHTRLRPDLGPSPDVPLARNLVLYGPPGTGKTHLAKAVARALTGNDEVREDGRFRLVQFHPSYAYEDFVQGMRPDLKHTDLRYQIQKGPFVRVAEAAEQEPDLFFVLVIDEINRGDPARIFGELLYALEYRGEAVSLALGGELTVPPNLVIIGTMNSVDRSVALVDYALRRRFGFVRVDPDPAVIAKIRTVGTLGEVGAVVLERFNQWLQQRLSREHLLGHSFFISPSIPDDAANVFDLLWRADIRPLMEEYFFGDLDGLAAAETEWKEIVRRALEDRDEVEAESNAQTPPQPQGRAAE